MTADKASLRVVCCVLLAAFCTGSRRSHPPFFSQVDLFHQGENGVNTYRIPALVQTEHGALIAVVDARYDSSHDLPGRIALVMRRSLDGGRIWHPMRTILSVPAGGVGDPALLLDRSNGRVWCFHAYGPPGIGFPTAKAGSRTGATTLQIHAIYSDDDGVTWSPDRDLTPQIKDPAWQAVFATSGTDIQLKSGRFLVPLVVRDEKGIMHSVNAYSDDHGKTWKVGRFIGEGTDESHNVELEDGVVLQNMRTHRKVRAIALSRDGGITFGPVTYDRALIDPDCNGGIASYYRASHQLLIFTNAASTRRESLTVKVSYDEAQTWPQQRIVNPGPSAYSTVIVLHDGTLGLLYERGGAQSDESITFARFNIAWLAQDAQYIQ